MTGTRSNETSGLCQIAHIGTYHVANKGQCSWFEFATEIVRFLSIDVSVTLIKSSECPTKAKRPAYSALESILPRYGIQMRHWKEALRDYMQTSLKFKLSPGTIRGGGRRTGAWCRI